MNNICETGEVTGNLNISFSSTFDLQDKVFSLFDQFEKVSDQCFDMEALPSSSKQVKAKKIVCKLNQLVNWLQKTYQDGGWVFDQI